MKEWSIIRKSKRFYVFIALAVIWMSVIFAFSNKNGEESSGQSNFIVDTVIDAIDLELDEDEYSTFTFIVRKTAHFTEYTILGILYMGIVYECINRKKIKVIFSTILCMIYAITDEIHQGFVGGRSPQVTDVMIDTMGGLLGGVICLLILYKVGKREIK